MWSHIISSILSWHYGNSSLVEDFVNAGNEVADEDTKIDHDNNNNDHNLVGLATKVLLKWTLSFNPLN